jgi:hypothetical protein
LTVIRPIPSRARGGPCDTQIWPTVQFSRSGEERARGDSTSRSLKTQQCGLRKGPRALCPATSPTPDPVDVSRPSPQTPRGVTSANEGRPHRGRLRREP